METAEGSTFDGVWFVLTVRNRLQLGMRVERRAPGVSLTSNKVASLIKADGSSALFSYECHPDHHDVT